MTNMVGRTIDNKYRLVRLLGEGGMALVYEAEHTVINRKVAVKIMRAMLASAPGATKRFLREAKTAAKIEHPNVVEIHDVGVEDDGTVFIVMELLKGRSLKELLELKGRLSASTVVSVMMQVLSALAAAHKMGIIHRDLKPDNVFIALDNRMREEVKLLDFGIAKIEGQPEGDLKLTKTGMVMGTPHYLSPEQARGGKKVDHRIDIWAVGVLMYEMLTGVMPFDGTSYNEVLGNILMELPVPLHELNPDAPKDLVDIVNGALTKDRDKRYQSVLEMVRDLMPLQEKLGVELSLPVFRALSDSIPPPPVSGASASQELEEQETEVRSDIIKKRSMPPEEMAGSAQSQPLDTGDLEVLEGMEELRPSWRALTDRMRTRRAALFLGAALAAAALVTLVIVVLSGRTEGDSREVVAAGHAAGDTSGADGALDAATALATSPSEEPDSASADEAKDAAEVEATPAKISLDIQGAPEGAKIWLDGQRVEPPVELPPSQIERRVRVTAAGYRPFETSVVADQDRVVSVDLVPRAKSQPDRSKRPRDRESGSKNGKKQGGSKSGKVWADNPFG